jgi:ketol-acid reductoisomerase
MTSTIGVASETSGSARGWQNPLDRISNGIYRKTVRLHWKEHQQYRRNHRELVRRAASLHLGEKLAQLMEQILQKQAASTQVPAAPGGDAPRILAA